jgi:uncharacterized protein (UPF0297 family)
VENENELILKKNATMTFFILLITLIAVFVIFIFIANDNSNQKLKETITIVEKNLSEKGFQLSQAHGYFYKGNSIALDIIENRIAIIDSSHEVSVFDISKFNSCEYKDIYKSITTTAKSETTVNQIYLESIITLKTNDISNPIIKIFLNSRETAEKIAAQINLMLDKK